jgi:hypothetical protein
MNTFLTVALPSKTLLAAPTSKNSKGLFDVSSTLCGLTGGFRLESGVRAVVRIPAPQALVGHELALRGGSVASVKMLRLSKIDERIPVRSTAG